MTVTESIRLLNPETTAEAIAEIEYYNGFSGKKAAIQAITDATIIACEAMKKQIPKKPTDTADWKSANLTIGICRICSAGVNSDMKHCNKCSQALDWGDEDD